MNGLIFLETSVETSLTKTYRMTYSTFNTVWQKHYCNLIIVELGDIFLAE
jgi:hypothetical protein